MKVQSNRVKVPISPFHPVRTFYDEFDDPTSRFINEIFLDMLSSGRRKLDKHAHSPSAQMILNRQELYLTKKAPFLGESTPELRKQSALSTFMRCESLCREANVRFRQPRMYPDFLRIQPVLHRASEIILLVLGDTPPTFSALHPFTYSSGNNVGVQRYSSPMFKLGNRLTCSDYSTRLMPDLLAELPLLSSVHSFREDDNSWTVELQMVDGKWGSVPKNAETDRSIVTEPTLNMLGQLAHGRWLKRRLKHFGVDLYDQSLNRDRARQASIDGVEATIDLSDASSSICKELVFDLLPPLWAARLDELRSHVVSLPSGERLLLEMFSSMGNGFTFELESLIFYSLVRAICESLGIKWVPAIYGDDIIVDVRAYPMIQDVFSQVGFRVNESKTFTMGDFRESCGGDYLSGCDVRPFVVDRNWSVSRLVAFHNHITRKGFRTYTALEEIVRFIQTIIPRGCRFWGPDGYGDGHLISYQGYPKEWSSDKYGDRGFYFCDFRTITAKPSVIPAREGNLRGLLLLGPYWAYTRETAPKPDMRVPVRLPNGGRVWVPLVLSVAEQTSSDPYVIRGHDGGRVTRITGVDPMVG